MFSLTSALVGALLLGAEADQRAASDVARFDRCLLSAISDVEVPAQEAGVLAEVKATPGSQVQAGDLVANINDVAAQLGKEAAAAERDVALEKATNDVNARYAEAVRKVAESEYRLNAEANARVPGTKSFVEMQKLQLTIDQAAMQLEQAKHEQKLAALTAMGNNVKVRIAEDEITRRQVRAPIAGEVVEVHYHAGEWVQPGDTVLRIVQLDRLRVEAFVKVEKHPHRQVDGRPVRVEVLLNNGQTMLFNGKVTFVDPRVEAGGVYRVWAEVDNRKVGGRWLLNPGLEANMTIELAKGE